MNKSQKLYSQMIAGALVVSAVVAPTAVGAEEVAEKSAAVVASNVTLTNNVTIKDKVKVSGLKQGDIVKVYSNGKVIGKATADSSSVEITLSAKLPEKDSTIQVSRKETGKPESDKIDVTVGAEPASAAPGEVSHANNVKQADTVTVKGVAVGDVIKVYADAEKTKLIGKATAKETSVTIKISKKFTTKDKLVDGDAEKFFVTRTEKNKLEGPLHAAEGTPVDLEKTTKISTAVTADVADDIELTVVPTNNARKADVVEVKGLKEGDVVTLYSSNAEDKEVIGKGTVKKGQKSVKITIKAKKDLTKIFTKTEENATGLNDLYFSVKRGDQHPSALANVALSEEVKTDNPTKIKVNNTVKKDTLTVTVKPKDTVKVYAAVRKTNEDGTVTSSVEWVKGDLLGTAKAKKDGTATVSIKGGFRNAVEVDTTTNKVTDKIVLDSTTGLPTFAPVIVTNMTDAKLEADGTTFEVTQEPASKQLSDGKIKVVNNYKEAGTVTVSGLVVNEVVKVYADAAKTTLLGQAKAKKDGTATVSIPDGFTKTDSLATDVAATFKPVFVTLTSANKTEGQVFEKVVGQYQGTTVTAKQISTINNVDKDIADAVKVTGLKAGDIVTVYDAATDGKKIGEATVSGKGTEVIVELDETFKSTVVDEVTTWTPVHVSVKSVGLLESARQSVTPSKEAQTKKPIIDAIANNEGKADTIKISNLDTNAEVLVTIPGADGSADPIKVGEATATKTGVVTIELDEKVTIADGTILTVTAKSPNQNESVAVTKAFPKAGKTTKLTSSQVTAANNVNAEKDDTLTITGVVKGDVIRIYNEDVTEKTAEEKAALKPQEVTATGTTVNITLDAQFKDPVDDEVPAIFVTRQTDNQQESDPLSVTPKVEAVTKLSATDITTVNNVDIEDTVTVKNVKKGDTVKIYSALSGDKGDSTKVIGEAVATGSTVTIKVIPTGATKATGEGFPETSNVPSTIYVTKKSQNEHESAPVDVVPSETAISTDLAAGSVKVTNNVTISDTVTVTGVAKGDVVTVYDATSAGNKLGEATATGSTVTVTLDAAATGKVYVDRKSTNKRVSANRLEASSGTQVDATQFTVVNNVTSQDKVTLKGSKYAAGDTIKIYDQTGKTLLHTEAVKTDATVTDDLVMTLATTKPLPTNSTTILVSITSTGTNEGEKVEVTYEEEPESKPLTKADVSLTSSKLTLTTGTNVNAGDIVKVYKAGSTTLIGTALTVADDTKEITFNPALTAGTYEVTVTKTKNADGDAQEHRESERFAITLEQTAAPTVFKANADFDAFAISGLKEGDVYNITGPTGFTAVTGTLSTEQVDAKKIPAAITLPGTYTIVVTNASGIASQAVTTTVEQVAKATSGTSTDGKTIVFTGAPAGATPVVKKGDVTVEAASYANGVFTAKEALTAGDYTVVFTQSGKLPSAAITVAATVPTGS